VVPVPGWWVTPPNLDCLPLEGADVPPGDLGDGFGDSHIEHPDTAGVRHDTLEFVAQGLPEQDAHHP
jgi:hypothetical protein